MVLGGVVWYGMAWYGMYSVVWDGKGDKIKRSVMI